jgi:hypothetical protein
MELDIKRIEQKVNENPKDKKRYDDLFFLFNKIKYHIENFKKLYPDFIKKHEQIDKTLGVVGYNFLFEQI